MKTKVLALMVAAVAFLLNPIGGTAKAAFGNSPVAGSAFDFIANGGIASGGAVAFTPVQDFSFTSVTVWLTGYTGLDMYGNKNQSFYAGIYADQPADAFGYGVDQPGTLLANLSCPAPNDGSLAAFEFANLSPDLKLQANTKYWLFIYENTSGSVNYDSYPQWVQGDKPSGNATYNGSQDFWAYDFSSTSATPAFAINAVPEPGALTLFVAALLGWGVYLLLRLRRRQPVPVSKRVHHQR